MEFKPKRSGTRVGIRTKRATTPEEEDGPSTSGAGEGELLQDSAEVQRNKMEEIKLLHKLRRKAGGTNAQTLMAGGRDNLHELQPVLEPNKDEERNELLGTFSKAEMKETTEEDPNMKSFIEAELARRLGRSREDGSHASGPEGAEAKRKRLEAELYQVPAELQTDMGSKDVVIPGMNMVITEVPTSASVRIRNIEETEAMKRSMLGGAPERDPVAEAKASAVRRKEFVPSFGKQARQRGDPDVDRELAEENNKRMRFITEKRPAISTAKEQRFRR